MLVQCAGTTRCGRELFGPGPEKGRASELAETWARPAGSSGERRPSLERLLHRLGRGQTRTRVPPEPGRAGESLPAPRHRLRRLASPRHVLKTPAPPVTTAAAPLLRARMPRSMPPARQRVRRYSGPARFRKTVARPVHRRGPSVGARLWGPTAGSTPGAHQAAPAGSLATRPLAADGAPRCGTSALHSASLSRSERAVILASCIRHSPQRQVGTRADPRSRHQSLCGVSPKPLRRRL